MAKGKLSPRQRMINLMYLIFIAMLALNMSKEVLTAFGTMNEKLADANAATTVRNDSFMSGLETKAKEQPEKYKSLAEKAQKVSVISDKLANYVEALKKEATDNLEDSKDYETMDKSNHFDEEFYRGGKISSEGKEFVDEIDSYREKLISLIGEKYPQIATDVKQKFSTQPVKDREGVKKDWLFYNYVGFPLVASVTKLTQIQSDVKSTESQILSAMLSGQLQSEVSMDNYTTLLETPKTAYYEGEKFDGSIVLGRTDETTKPNKVSLTLDGQQLSESDYTIENGHVKLNVATGNVGDHKIEGNLVFEQNGESIEVPVSSQFAVISKPNSAVISADKMNVLYRGVQNPLTISMPGVSNDNVKASAPGLRHRSGSSYAMNVTSLKSRTVKINVTGSIDGKSYPSSSTFRIKEIPRPVGTVRGQDGASGPIRMQRNGLSISTIGAEIPDFDFDLSLNVSAFKMQVAGQPIIQVSGHRLNKRAKSTLSNAKRGAMVQIFDIVAKISGNSSYRLPPVSPITIQLTN